MGTNNKDHAFNEARSPSHGESQKDCLQFEEKLNEWIDLCWLEQDHALDSTTDAVTEHMVRLRDGDQLYFDDAHVHHCANCRKLQTDYIAMFASTKSPLLRDLPETSTAHREHSPRLERSRRNQPRSNRSQLNVSGAKRRENYSGGNKFGWSTALVILFLLLGLPPQLDTSSVEVSNDSPARFDGTMFTTNVGFGSQVSNLQLPDLSVLTDGHWFNVLVPEINLASVDLMQLNPRLNQVGHYWQRAARLPGIEPWQHSVNFAIGWLNQTSQSGQPSASDIQSSQLQLRDLGDGSTYCVNTRHCGFAQV